MQDEGHKSAGASRRDFLKKAGAVAWVVPTMQIVNMAAAGAQTNGSIVTTTSSTTTRPPEEECAEYFVCTIKAEWTGNGYVWSDGGLGDKACVDAADTKCNGSSLGATISGDERQATVTVPEHCEILQAAHKSGSGEATDYCTAGTGSGRSRTFSAEFDARQKDISNIQLLVKCCVDNNE